MSVWEKATNLLRKHELKKTSSRLEILKVLMELDYAVSHSELESILSEKLDRVTIYRTLNAFEESGITHKILDNEGIAKFALCHDCDHDHHHDEHIHFHCTKCQNIYCLDHAPTPQLEMPSGYKMDDFSISVSGVCQTCNSK